MRNIYFLLFTFCLGFSLNAQIVNIPDANFKAKLLSANTTNGIAYNNPESFNSVVIDINNSGEIEVGEALLIRSLHLSNSNIMDLTGIESFTNLATLWCDNNQLNVLNLTNLSNLNKLFCFNNQLENINISSNHMSWLVCRNNMLSNINLSLMPNLSQIDCSYNYIQNLNFNNHNLLYQLVCNNNQLTSLSFSSHLLFLDCSNNQINDLDISSTDFEIGGDWIGGCDFSNNPITNLIANNDIAYVGFIDFNNTPNLQSICCKTINFDYFQYKVNQYGYDNCSISTNCVLKNQNFNIEDIFVLFPNPAKDILTIQTKENIEVSSINIYNTFGQLVLLIPNAKDISTIDVSSLKTGNYFIKVLSDKGVSSTKFIKE